MKLQNIVYVLTVGGALLTSCSDFLDTESPSVQSSTVTFENEGMTRSAIMGVYSELAGTYVYGQKMSVNWQGVSDIELASGYATDPSKDLTRDRFLLRKVCLTRIFPMYIWERLIVIVFIQVLFVTCRRQLTICLG